MVDTEYPSLNNPNYDMVKWVSFGYSSQKKESRLSEQRNIAAHYETLTTDEVESRDMRTCLSYRERLRGARFAPAWHEFDWDQVPTHCISDFTVVDVVPPPLDFVYRFWGTHLAEGQKQELTGQSAHNLRPTEEADIICRQYREVVDSRQPVFFRSAVFGWSRLELAGIALRMPFSNDGEQVTNIVSLTDFNMAYKTLEDTVDLSRG